MLTIQDNVCGTNTIELGSGITTGDVSLAASGNDLLITDGVSGDQITIKNQLTTQLGITVRWSSPAVPPKAWKVLRLDHAVRRPRSEWHGG